MTILDPSWLLLLVHGRRSEVSHTSLVDIAQPWVNIGSCVFGNSGGFSFCLCTALVPQLAHTLPCSIG
jgi:hypothetical protein